MRKPREIVSNIVGQQYNMLTAIHQRAHPNPRMVLCRCDCGTLKFVDRGNLLALRQMSCGCYIRSIAGRQSLTHGRSGTRTYKIWKGLFQRCRNPRRRDYWRYGGRGIDVAPEWESFEAFFADMGESPPGTVIDRIDNQRGYEPGNCRWATYSESNLNRPNFGGGRRKAA